MARASRVRALVAVGALLVLALAATLGALALRVSDEDEPVLPVTAVTYVEAVPGTWQRINPLFDDANSVDQDIVALVFNGLVRIGEAGVVEPDLAQALPAVGPDGRTYTFTLRENLEWHDGEPVTASDVAFTIETIRSIDFTGDASLVDAWADIESVAVADARTITITLPEPSAPFLARVATLPIVPEHLLGGMSSEQMARSTFNAEPIGTGPYRLTSLSSSRADFVSNTGYHLGRPSIERLSLRFHSSTQSAITALENGEVDGLFIEDPAGTPLPSPMDDFAVHSALRYAYDALYLNNAQAALFQDPLVRRAFSLAVDRAVISEEIFGGAMHVSASPIPPGTWAYREEFDNVAQDRTTAEALLDEAEWTRDATTGIRTRSGQEFRITIRTDDDPRHVEMGRIIAEQLDAIGIKATVASTSFSVLRTDFLQTRSYEAAIIAWDQGPDPDPYYGWHSSQLGAAGLNIANYSDISADLVIERARESSAEDIRLDMYRQFQDIWANSDAPSLVLGYLTYSYAVSNDVEAVIPGNLVSPAHRFAQIHLWTA